MLKQVVMLVVCLLGLAACSSIHPHGVDTGDKTIPVYKQPF